MRPDSRTSFGGDPGHPLDSRQDRKSSLLDSARGRILTGAGGALLLVTLAVLLSGDASWHFKVYVIKPGVYEITYEDLQRAGLDARSIDSENLALTNHGAEVPIWVADGADGRFGRGDRIEFVGEHLPGHRSTYSEHSLLNVYRLAVGKSHGLRMSSPALPEAAARKGEPAHVEVDSHWEENNFLVHFPDLGTAAPEPRFWARLSHISVPFARDGIWLGRSREGSRPLSLKVRLRGWSRAGRSQGGQLPDHRVELYFNSRLVGAGEWDGQDGHVIEVPEVPADLVKHEAGNLLEVKVPRRRPSSSADPLVDVVLLDWIEIRFPPPEANSTHGGSWIPSRAQRFVLPRTDSIDLKSPAKIRLATAPHARLVVYGDSGTRFDGRSIEVEDHAEQALHYFYPPPQDSVFHVVPTGALLSLVAVELDNQSSLRDRSRQADYIIVAHPSLLQAIEPLAEFHRLRGLKVAVVAVDDVYDEFNHSILHPSAIRDFLSYAYHEWQRPAPRFVLLVGDASWDAERSGGTYKDAAPYPPKGQLTHRNLVPTSTFEGPKGHAASDNFFVAIDGEDHLPDLAIGRFPVTEPEVVAAIVEKSLRYSNEAVGPWRRKILWLSDETSFMKERSDLIAEAVTGKGFASLKLYPAKGKPSTEQTQGSLLRAFDSGQMLVHFLGHGARHVWRIGITDHREKFDLFGLEHLPRLQPTGKVPLVLSMTCWSAPFDHPTASSIGENFLSLEGRGAVAFFGASWKVSPNKPFSDLLLEGLTSPGTIGEAILQAKRSLKTRNLIENYNLLGDPAIELSLPAHPLEIAVKGDDDQGWEIVATVPVEGFEGHSVVDWLDEGGEVVSSERGEVRNERLEASFRRSDDARPVASVRVYVWNRDSGVDGMGARELIPGQE